jgi:hypothetical protein
VLALVVAAQALMLGCGGSAPPSGAPAPDAAAEVSDPCPRASCGSQCCESVVRVCMPACACPDATVFPSPFKSSIDVIDPRQVPGALTAIALFAAPDGGAHSLVVGYTPDLPLGTDLPLAMAGTSGTPLAAIGWRVDVAAQTSLSALFGTAGVLNLSRACAAGVAGKLTGLTFSEQRTLRDSTPYPGGCSFAVSEIDFAIGGPCP